MELKACFSTSIPSAGGNCGQGYAEPVARTSAPAGGASWRIASELSAIFARVEPVLLLRIQLRSPVNYATPGQISPAGHFPARTALVSCIDSIL